MEDKMRNDFIESQGENKSTNIDNEKSNGRKSWWWNPLGCLYRVIGFIIIMLLVSSVRCCVKSSFQTQTNGDQIQSVFKQIRDELPQRVDDVTELVDAKITNESIIFVYEIDDTKFDLSTVDRTSMKSSMLADWGSDFNQIQLAQFCVNTNRSVVLKYRSTNTRCSFSLTFSTSELKSKIDF